MKKSTWIVLALIIVVIVAAGISVNRKSADNGPIKIGFIGPLTGDAAAYGVTEKNAIAMALDQVKQEPEFKNRQIEVIYEDGKCAGKDASTAAQKLISVDAVKFILGGVCSAETLGAAPIAEKSGVILFSSFSSAPAVTDAGDYIFRNSPSDTDAAKLDAGVIAKKYKKVAIVSETSDYSVGLRQAFLQNLSGTGATVVADEQYPGTLKDFRTILAKVKQAGPDVVYFDPGTSPAALALLLNQARDIGITVPFYSNFFMGNEDAIKNAGKNAEGVIFSDGINLPGSGQTLLDQYKARFGSAPGNEFEFGATYDRVMILTNAIAKVGADSAKVRDYLYSMPDYKGVIGAYHFDKNGDMTLLAFQSFIVKDGKKVPYVAQ